MKTRLALLMIGFGAWAFADCSSIRFSRSGGWLPAASAPHNGTIVELMETYGIAPWYGLFKWTTVHKAVNQDNSITEYEGDASWQSVVTPTSVREDSCLFWRPYRKPVSQYVDPTGGAQDSIPYWCAAMHAAYDPKTGYCKK